MDTRSIRLYYIQKGQGAYKIDSDGIKTKLPKSKGIDNLEKLNIVVSRSHRGGKKMDEYISRLKSKCGEINYKSAGSTLKFGKLAEGKVDIYPRLKPCMERDTAAGHIILREVGKEIYIYKDGQMTDQPLRYNKPSLLNPYFIAL